MSESSMIGRPVVGRRRPPFVVPDKAFAMIRAEARELVEAGAVDGSTRPLDGHVDALLAGWLAYLPAERVIAPRPPEPPAPPADADPPNRHLGLRALTALAFVADGANLTVALSVVGNAAPVATLIVVIGLAGIALGLAHSLGGLIRRRIEGWGPSPRSLRLAMLAMIILIGLVAASIRLSVPSPSVAGSTFGGGPDPAAVARADLVNLLLTVLLLTLYLASTLMAAYIAFLTCRAPSARTVLWSRNWGARREQRRWWADRRRNHRRTADAAAYRATAERLRCAADQVFGVALGSPSAVDGLTARPTRKS